MKLTDIQKQISSNNARFKVVVAGRRSGKTYLSINEVAKAARHPNRKVMYIAPTYRMARQIFWEDLKDQLRRVNWIKRINESNLEITLVNNSLIMLRSADRFDNIRGIGLDYVVCDEMADFDEAAWTTVIRPTLADRNGGALLLGTPKGRNFFYELFTNADALEDWSSWQFTTAQGGIVSEAELNQAKADMDRRSYEQEFEAQFVNYAGIIYYAFEGANLTKWTKQLKPRERLFVGIDFNVSPICAVIAYYDNGILHVLDEIEIFSSNTNELCAEIRERYPEQIIEVFPDASGAQRRTSAGGLTDHIILHNAGFKVTVGNVNPSIKDRIAAVNSMLCNTSGQRTLLIDPDCKSLINALRKHTYKENTRQPEKDSGFDHLLDALGYMVMGIKPIKPNYAPVGKMRMGTGRSNVRR